MMEMNGERKTVDEIKRAREFSRLVVEVKADNMPLLVYAFIGLLLEEKFFTGETLSNFCKSGPCGKEFIALVKEWSEFNPKNDLSDEIKRFIRANF